MLQELYNKARAIPQELELTNKYTWLAYNNVLEARYLDLNDTLVQRDIQIGGYISRNEAILLFPNIVGDKIVDIFVKPLYSKAEPLKLGDDRFPYNIGNLDPGFKYGDPLVLVEGLADGAALKLISPRINFIVMQRSSLSMTQLELLSQITNKFIVIPDRDEAGTRGYTKMWYRFRDLGATCVSLNQFRYFKDTGDLLDRVLYYLNTRDTSILEEIELAQTYYKTALEIEVKKIGGV